MIYVLIDLNRRWYKAQINRQVGEYMAFITLCKYDLFNNIKFIYGSPSINIASFLD